jgi:hypothetical protein
MDKEDKKKRRRKVGKNKMAEEQNETERKEMK